jgi:hypothetical protein
MWRCIDLAVAYTQLAIFYALYRAFKMLFAELRSHAAAQREAARERGIEMGVVGAGAGAQLPEAEHLNDQGDGFFSLLN